MRNISIDKIKELLEAYGIPDADNNKNSNLCESLFHTIRMGNYLYHSSGKKNAEKELLEVILFLKSCQESDLILKGTITNPTKGQIKNTELKLNLNDDNGLVSNLYYFVNTLLDKNQSYYFNYEFGWDFKKPLKYKRMVANKEKEVEHSFFVEPYSDEELQTLSDYYEIGVNETIKESPNLKLGKFASILLDVLKNYEVSFNKTKCYSLVYDLMIRVAGVAGKEVITEDGYSGYVGSAKFQELRKWVNAWEKHLNK